MKLARFPKIGTRTLQPDAVAKMDCAFCNGLRWVARWVAGCVRNE
jgi:hypothetical protein